MGSCLGPTFSDFYMTNLENTIFQTQNKPKIYLRYVDDILILTNNVNEVIKLQTAFQSNSVLTFTYELNKNNKIPFLDVLIHSNSDPFITSPYKKPTSQNSCLLNYKSECPEHYKTAVIKNFIRKAKLISSSHNIFYKSLSNIKQTLINNGYPNNFVDKQINRVFKIRNVIKKYLRPVNQTSKIDFIIYYRKFFVLDNG